MKNMLRSALFSFLLGLIAFTSACVVEEPREGYWDTDHRAIW